MHNDLILFRTPKGEEIAHSHGHEISSNHRRALIAVDGKTSVGALTKKVFWVSDVVGVLKELYTLGLIHDDVKTIQDATVTQSGGAGLLLKVQIIKIAKELLGNNAERIVKKIEDTEGTPEALEATILSCKKLIKLTINDDVADAFLARALLIIGR
ncbi:MAG: hypothetical protein HOP20_01700 [Sulfuriferula sp.]|nr:hypothetical protein [Sulfuriferula sp.]